MVAVDIDEKTLKQSRRHHRRKLLPRYGHELSREASTRRSTVSRKTTEQMTKFERYRELFFLAASRGGSPCSAWSSPWRRPGCGGCRDPHVDHHRARSQRSGRQGSRPASGLRARPPLPLRPHGARRSRWLVFPARLRRAGLVARRRRRPRRALPRAPPRRPAAATRPEPARLAPDRRGSDPHRVARRRAVRRGFLFAGIAFAFVALARPELGFTWTESKRRGIDVMLAVDVSRDMLARDVSPRSLDAREARRRRPPRAPAGRPRRLDRLRRKRLPQTPLTLDEVAFRHSVEALTPGVIPRGGSDLASAIRVAITRLPHREEQLQAARPLSDGGDLAGDALAAADEAAAEKVPHLHRRGRDAGRQSWFPDEEHRSRFVEDEGKNRQVTARRGDPPPDRRADRRLLRAARAARRKE